MEIATQTAHGHPHNRLTIISLLALLMPLGFAAEDIRSEREILKRARRARLLKAANASI